MKAQSFGSYPLYLAVGVPLLSLATTVFAADMTDENAIVAKAKSHGYTLNSKESIRYYRDAVILGDPEGKYRLGQLLFNGDGIGLTCPNLPTETYDDQNNYKQNCSYKAAVALFRNAADQGSLGGLHNLAMANLVGKGVAKDQVRGLDLLRTASNKGYGNSTFQLAFWTLEGQLGIPKDVALGMTMLRTAADQESYRAMDYLGMEYLKGKRVPTNWPQAVIWFKKAASLGSDESLYHLAYVYKVGGQGVTADRALSLRYLRDAADKGNVDAILELAIMMYKGQLR